MIYILSTTFSHADQANGLINRIFSSAVFGENPRYCYSLGVIVVVGVVQKLLTFCNISLTAEDIYLKLGFCVHYPKINLYYQGRQFKMHIVRIVRLFRLRFFYPLSRTSHLSVGTCVQCSC